MALLVSMNGHLAVIQTFAWGKMLADFSKDSSLKEAAEKTFDGDHPCPMCKVVKEAKKTEEKKPVVEKISKVEIVLPTEIVIKEPVGSPVTAIVPLYFGSSSEVVLAVPVQPPRAA